MGWRFFHRVRLMPGVTLNLSKRGASTSVGVRGAHLTVGPNGATVSAGISGTGLSWRQRVARAWGRK
jgi:hypothetical protein